MNTVNGVKDDKRSEPSGVKKRAHLTVSAEQLLDGALCSCEACVREGPHEPDCAVHDEPRGSCTCSRKEQTEAAG